MSFAIRTQQLTVSYGGEPALWNVDLEIPEFSMTGILGPNGAGKSTLLKAILGVIPCLSGSVEVAGTEKSPVAYVPQRTAVDWDFPTTVLDLVMMGTYGRLRWFQRPGRKEREDALAALDQVRMREFADRQIGELSGGQQQRIFLARAFVQQASIYLLDEPFTGVDATTENLIMEILRELRDAGNTIVFVHHDLTTVRSYFDHVVLLNKRLIETGPVGVVFTDDNIQQTYGVMSRSLQQNSSDRQDENA